MREEAAAIVCSLCKFRIDCEYHKTRGITSLDCGHIKNILTLFIAEAEAREAKLVEALKSAKEQILFHGGSRNAHNLTHSRHDVVLKKIDQALSQKGEQTFICSWCGEEKPISAKCGKGYCISCSSYDF